MDILGIGNAISKVIDGVADKIIPDAAQREQFKIDARRISLDEIMEPIKVQLSAILEEARSQDKWTSRARPSFLYVMYIMIFCGVPIGILSVFSPESATQIAEGMQAWLKAIPDSLYTLFGVGYLGYTGARSWDKTKNGK